MSRYIARSLVLGLLSFPLLAAPSVDAKAIRPSELILKDGFPPITPEESSLTEVPFDRSAVAAVLLNAQQVEQVVATKDMSERIQFYRRVKILSSAGVERYGRWSMSIFGRWRLEKAMARTVLPDGTVVDASEGIQRKQSKGASQDTEFNRLDVVWPQVREGAILDLYVSAYTEGIPSQVWRLQERLPVIDSRFVVEASPAFGFNMFGLNMSSAETQPQTFKYARGQAFVWQWTDLPGIVDEPLSPSIDEVSKTLIVYPTAYHDRYIVYDWATDWRTWNVESKEFWDQWARGRSSSVVELAKSAAASATSPEAKAEAIRSALRSRMRFVIDRYGRSAGSPDEVLSRGFGSASEVAVIAALMLESVEVPSDVCVYRRRSSGMLPVQVPLPDLLDAALLRFRGEKGLVYFDPAGAAPAGTTPYEARGAAVFPLDGKAAGPTRLPDVASSDNKVERTTTGRIDRDGSLHAEGTFTFSGLAAERRRIELESQSESERKESFVAGLRRHVPGAELESLEVEGLEGGDPIVLKAKWRAEGYASAASAKLIANLSLFERLDPAAWAVESRTTDIDFGAPFDHEDSITVAFPAEAGTITVPAPFQASGPPVGRYAAKFEVEGKSVTLTRSFRVDRARVPAAAWITLKSWFRSMAKADDQPVVVELP